MDQSASDRIAVIGSGGIGGYLAAKLVEAGRDVVLCVRTPFEELSITEEGGTRTVPVRLATEPSAVGPVRWILLTTKAQDTAGAAPWIRALAGPDSVLAMVQNGIGHAERAAAVAPDVAALPAIIWCSVERAAPGRITHHGSRRLAVPEGGTGEAFARLFAGTGFEVEAREDFRTVAWQKFIANLVANALTALTLRRTVIFEEPAIMGLAQRILAEALAVGQAEGAKLTGADVDRVYTGLGRHGAHAGTSMLYDRLAGRPLEHRHLTGALIEAADRHGLAVPVNRTLYALLEAVSGQPLDASR